MFTTPCFIRKNTPELRDKLRELGYIICSCTTSKTAIYLMVGYESVHAVIDEAIDLFEDEVKAGILKSIDCGDDERLFLALAAMRDDTDMNQYFVEEKGMHWVNVGTWVSAGSLFLSFEEKLGRKKDCHRATADEIIAHFKQKEL